MGIFDKLSKPNVEKMEAKKDVKGLIKALRYEDRDVRRAAVYASRGDRGCAGCRRTQAGSEA